MQVGPGSKQTVDCCEASSRGEARPPDSLLDHFVETLSVLRRGALSAGELEQSVSNCFVVKLFQKDARNTRFSRCLHSRTQNPTSLCEETLSIKGILCQQSLQTDYSWAGTTPLLPKGSIRHQKAACSSTLSHFLCGTGSYYVASLELTSEVQGLKSL